MKCIICNNLLADKKEIEKYKKGKLKSLYSRGGLFKPLIYEFGDEKIECFCRNKCYECFEKEFKRKPKRFNVPNYDLKWFFPNIDENKLKRILSNRNGITKEKLIKKYGEIEGIEKWNSYCKKQSITNTFEYKNKKYGMSKKQFNEYNKSRSITKNNMIKKYGEIDGIKRWNSYCKKQSYAGVKLEYFIEKYGEIEGTKKYNKLSNSKKITLENLIKKYGKVEGTLKYKSFLNKRPDFYSKISQECFWKIYENIKEYINKNKLYFAELNKEFVIYKNRPYKYDFVISDLKICVEFNGDLFHANPLLYNEMDTPNPYNKNLLSKDIWKLDEEKNKIIKDKNFDLYIIWEKDYIDNCEEIVYFITNKIKEKYECFKNK